MKVYSQSEHLSNDKGMNISNNMKRMELVHHYIEGSYGGNQEWFLGPMMKLGGCGAETACECSIYFTNHFDKDLYPFDLAHLTIEDYKKFGTIMKPYLSPRMTGIDRLDIFIDGYLSYLHDNGEYGIKMKEFSGEENFENARDTIISQIDKGYPIPMLMLNHKDKRFKDYDWHWFIVNGYTFDVKAPAPGPWPGAGCAGSNSQSPDGSERFYIKTATYSEWDWFNLQEFWDTGFDRKGGLVLFDITSD